MKREKKSFVQAYSGGIRFLAVAAVLNAGCVVGETKPESLSSGKAYKESELEREIVSNWGPFQFSFLQPEYVHPKIIDALHGDFADAHSSVVEVDLLTGNNSEKFFGEMYFETRSNGDLWVMSKGTSGLDTEGAYCGYHYLGKSEKGMHLLEVVHGLSESIKFESILLVKLRRDFVIDLGFENPKERRSRVLIVNMGTIAIRDVLNREVSFANGILKVEYPSLDWKRNSIVPLSLELD